MKWRLVWMIAICTAFAAFVSSAEDWPRWRGLNGDGHSPETGLLKEWPADGLTPLWVVEGIGVGHAAVTVADDSLYVTGMDANTGEGSLSAFDLSCNMKWRQPYGPEWQESYPGARSSPTVDGKRLYIVTAKAKVVCFDAATGKIVWQRDTAADFKGEPPRVGYAESPLVVDDMVICTPGGPDAALVALDKATGMTVWTTPGFTDMSGYCSPILVERGGRRLIITITARHVIGLDPATGEVVWRQSFDPDAQDPNHSTGPVYADGRLYVTSGHRDGGQMFELAPAGASIELKWSDSVQNNTHGGLVLVDGNIYGSNAKGLWVCLEMATGKVMYEAEGVGPGSVACADGMLYCYGEKGKLALVKATPESFNVVSTFKVSQGEGPHWAHPVISGGRLYIRHGDFLMAYDIRAK